MDRPRVNFLDSGSEQIKEPHFPPKPRGFFGRHRLLLSLFLIFLIVGLGWASKVVVSGSNLAEQFGGSSLLGQLKYLVGAGDKTLSGQERDRINILLLGVGGVEHQGGQLTDTIMLVSLRPSDKKLALLSIPRDLVAPIPGVGWQRINYAHAFGKLASPKDKTAGPLLAEKAVTAVTGQPIDYYIKLNFDGFVKLIDALGGIRIYVPESFTDAQYPDNNYGYETLHFEQGWNDFDGSRALQYTRSRHGNNSQGSDFARARRQQEILRAAQIKSLALSTLLNPNKILKLMDVAGENLETDLEIWQALKLMDMAKSVNTNEIGQFVLSNEPGGLLAAYTSEDGAYLLRPRLGLDNFSEIKVLGANLLRAEPLEELKTAGAAEAEKLIKTAVQNGTKYPGLAAQTAKLLDDKIFKIIEIGNAAAQNYQQTIIFNLSKISNTAWQALAENLGAVLATSTEGISKPGADILLIVGADQIPADQRAQYLPEAATTADDQLEKESN